MVFSNIMQDTVLFDVVIIQPPLVQLNTPYPAGAYLSSFFKNHIEKSSGINSVRWIDLSNILFKKIFSHEGLEKIFTASSKRALNLASRAEKDGDDNTAFQLRRYISQRELWCKWIENILTIVSAKKESGRELVHEFVRSAHVPRGLRMENYISSLNRDVGADDAEILASLALADIADYISVAYDENFSLVRYAESIATSTAEFSQAEEALSAPILNDFMIPALREYVQGILPRTLFCISVPFPGNFAASLSCARWLKENFPESIIAFGGGYINTELRGISEKRFFNYADFISYDRGYGSFLHVFSKIKNTGFEKSKIFDGEKFYRTKYLFDEKIVEPLSENDSAGSVSAVSNGVGSRETDSRRTDSSGDDSLYKKILCSENKITSVLIPDYSDIDFSNYPRLADDVNPMHRIWNDGTWIKAYLAYGCYWHRCSFCDTTLEYVYGYCRTDSKKLYEGLYNQAKQKGVYGIHFVDEACPPAALEQFALCNARSSNSKANPRLTFWGNIRFEKTFSRDLADLLAYGGMTAVSAGIEIATDTGLSNVNKGTGMEEIVSACCAFKEAGILIHSYMIFGFYSQTEQDLINSMETLRQLFDAGLLDSAFWHKFVLTKHSTVFKEWQEGKHPNLKIIFPEKTFAENDLRFEGENKSEKYSYGLNAAVQEWMHGNGIKKKVQNWFNFKMPEPSIPKNFVENLIGKYEEKCRADFAKTDGRFVWIGGKMMALDSVSGDEKQNAQLCWSYMGDLQYADVKKSEAEKICDFINGSDLNQFSFEQISAVTGKKLFLHLRGKGLCRLL